MGMTEQKAISILGHMRNLITVRMFEEEALDMAIQAIEKQIPKQPTNKQGFPLWGYCPNCKKAISSVDCPIGCKWCLQRVSWGDEDE